MIHCNYCLTIIATSIAILHFISAAEYSKQSETREKRDIKFLGGCPKPPLAPLNGKVRCNPSGCRALCSENYAFPNRESIVYVDCENGKWIVRNNIYPNVPDCNPTKCNPPCLNNGVCVGVGKCKCPNEFTGIQCETEVKACETPPNTEKQTFLCTLTTCRSNCKKGYEFPDGSTFMETVCVSGAWMLNSGKPASSCEAACHPTCKNGGVCTSPNQCTCPEGYEGDHCQNVLCNPPCLNKGVCVSPNKCSCLTDFKGASCEYNTGLVCLIDNHTFNGKHECTMTDDSRECVLSCPKGMKPSQPFAEVYKCKFSEGKFQTENFPSCIPEEQPTTALPDVIPTRGKCYSWSGIHYKTFDGKIYGFTSPCPHILVEDVVDETFKITIENSEGCDATITDNCSRVIKLYYTDKVYTIKLINGVVTLMEDDHLLDMPINIRQLSIEYSGSFVAVNIENPLVKIKWDGNNYIKVTVGKELWKKTGGLCGTLDGHASNDMATKNGKEIDDAMAFIQHWRVKFSDADKCEDKLVLENHCYTLNEDKQDEAKKFCSELLKDTRFDSCAGRVDVTQFLDSCIWSYCACQKADPKECTCQTTNIYARECIDSGVTDLDNWRKQFCPLKCPQGRTYAVCAPKGAVCGEVNEDDQCQEGCYCPEGTVMHNDQCIKKQDCPCQYRGKEIANGSSVPKACNTCTCKEGVLVCTKKECKARCSSVGDPHYMTFDGKRYDFMGHCKYYLVKHANFSIIAENIACTGTVEEMANMNSDSELPSCTKGAIIEYAGHIINLNQKYEVIVDGEYVPDLPFTIDGVTIRRASSTFILAELPNNVQVTWDGDSRLFIDGSAALYGTTRGLCGTFNYNKDDDFLLPDGTIEENEVRFGNSWKTDPTCGDAKEDVEHPCIRNPKNKAAATRNCKMIKSKMFAECHWEVDPETFYQECLFDVCSCEMKLPRCFCPMIASYAAECARHGIEVEWRTKVKGCGVQCRAGQTYQACGNPCRSACSQMAKEEECEPECVEGCNCPEGQALDDYGKCVPIEKCDCVMDGVKYPAGHTEIKSMENADLSCTCVNATWMCKPNPRSEIIHLKLTVKEKCMSEGKKYTLCAPVEPTTCKNMHTNISPPKENCMEGCDCPTGYVLSEEEDTCIPVRNCPCFYGGRSYEDGVTVKKDDCNNCTCQNTTWVCTANNCPGLCSAWGNSHFKTFDGKEFNFQGQCDYVLAMGEVDNVGSFQIDIQNLPCGSSVSCIKSLTISVNENGNNESLVFNRDRVPVTTSNKNILVHEMSHYVIAVLPKLGVMVTWDKGNRVYVSLHPDLHNKVEGLCGNFNSDLFDDFKNPAGNLEDSAESFGDSWSLQPQCSSTEEVTDTCENKPTRKKWANKQCNVLHSSPFSDCHDTVPVAPFVEKCIFDACGCDEGGDTKCVCTALAAYAFECNRNGVPLEWRTPSLCPMQCDSTCSHYDPCIKVCPSKGSLSSSLYEVINKLCEDEMCVEGCKEKKCTSVKLPCMVIDGKLYYEGDLIEETECRVCHCLGGKKECQCTAGIKMH